MRAAIDDALLPLVAETNDQRRVVGQALWYLHRSLVFWRDRDRPFARVLSGWAPACAQAFSAVESRLRRLSPHARDEPLRRWLADVFRRLSADLAGGDRMALPFLRWLEGRFPALTTLMRDAERAQRAFDLELARALRWTFGEVAISEASGVVTALSRASSDLLRA